MSLTFEETGKRKFTISAKDLGKLTKQGARRAWFFAGKSLIKEASNEILRGQKTGRIYTVRRGATGRRFTYQSSAAGETHANVSGKLRRSLSYQAQSMQMEFGYGVSSGKSAPVYAGAIEFGFRPRKLKPRPTLKNAIKAQEGPIVNHFKREIGKRIGAT